MSSNRSRLAKLEKITGGVRCPECHGKPRLIAVGSAHDPAPAANPCSVCGNEARIIVVTGISRNPDDPLPEDDDSE